MNESSVISVLYAPHHLTYTDGMISRLLKSLYTNAYLLLALTALFWAGNAVVSRGVHGEVPPMALAWCRLLLSLLILLPFVWSDVKKAWPTVRKHLAILGFLGATGAGIFNMSFYFGVNYTEALNALVIQTSGPVLIVLATAIFFGDRINRNQAVGIAVSLVGVLTMIARGDPATLKSIMFNIGDLGILAAMIAWAVYTAFLRKRPPLQPLSFIALTFFVALVFVTPFFAVEHMSGWQLQPTWPTLFAIGYVAVFPSILAYICYNRGVELVGANRAGIGLYLVPFFGAILAITFLGEEPKPYHALGLTLILAGVLLAARKS